MPEPVTLQWHEIQTILHLIGKEIDAQPNRFLKQGHEDLFQKLYPLYETDPSTTFVIQVEKGDGK